MIVRLALHKMLGTLQESATMEIILQNSVTFEDGHSP